MIPRDKLGWPVVTFKGRPILNFIRLAIHCDIWRTIRDRKVKIVAPAATGGILCEGSSV